jgi:hypothetical protein
MVLEIPRSFTKFTSTGFLTARKAKCQNSKKVSPTTEAKKSGIVKQSINFQITSDKWVYNAYYPGTTLILW